MAISNECAARLLANRGPQLNHYQLGCGYIQRRVDSATHLSATLWHESSHYHVRVAYHDHPTMAGWLQWDGGIDTLTAARDLFARYCREYGIRGRCGIA